MSLSLPPAANAVAAGTSPSNPSYRLRAVLAAAGPAGALALAAACLVAVPGTDLLSDDPAANADLLNAVAEARDRTATAGLLVVLGLLALIPFVVILCSLVPRRGRSLATWGAGLAAAGLAGAAVANSFWFGNVRMTHPDLAGSRHAMVQLLGIGTWPLAVFGALEVVCLPLGWILLGVGLWRSRAVGRALPSALILGMALFLALPDRWGAVGAVLLGVVAAALVGPISSGRARSA